MSTALDPTLAAVAAELAPPPLTFWDRVRNNAEIAAKSGSSYVVIIAGILAALYASLTTGQQTQLVEAFPFLKGWAPAVTVVIAFIATKLKPSDTVSAQTKAMLSELATLRLNAYLRAHGAVEIPVATTPLAITPTIVPVPVAMPAALPVAPAVTLIPPPALADSAKGREIALLGLVQDYIAEQRARIPPQADAGSHQ